METEAGEEAVVEADDEIEAPAAFLEGMADNPADGESVEITLTLEALQEMASELIVDEGDDETEILDEEELEEAELSSKQKKIAAAAPPSPITLTKILTYRATMEIEWKRKLSLMKRVLPHWSKSLLLILSP